MTEKYIHKELIPLDIDYIANYLWDSRPKAYNEEGYKENIKKLLSKYGVHKQEGITREKCSYCGEKHNPIEHLQVPGNTPTPTPQATSVDTEEVAKNIYDQIFNKIDFQTAYNAEYIKNWFPIVIKAELKEYLSSLPIQKKRSKKYVNKNNGTYNILNSKTGYWEEYSKEGKFITNVHALFSVYDYDEVLYQD